MDFGNYKIEIVNDGVYEYENQLQEELLKKTTVFKNSRLLLKANCLLVKSPKNELILFDCGFGDSNFQRKGITKLSNETLTQNLEKLDVKPENISHVIQTHLHYDHAGNLATKTQNGNFKLTFPNAKIWIGLEEWESVYYKAQTPYGYEKEKLLFLLENAELVFTKGTDKLFDDFFVELTGGHTKGHRIIFLKSEGKILCYFGDILPMSSHLNLDSEMAYDVYKTEAKLKRKELSERATNENWFGVFYHSPRLFWGFLRKNELGKNQLLT
ncbi:MBL fold metallo-hydrolase [bacterium]|nr:MBL fold metallo-hydrolase [bacterium]